MDICLYTKCNINWICKRIALVCFPSFLCLQLSVPEQGLPFFSVHLLQKHSLQESIYAANGTDAIYSLKEALPFPY